MKSFKNRFLFNLYYFLFWIVYFVFARSFFLMYYYDKTQELSISTIFKTFVYGIQLDASFSAYLSLIPFLLMLFSAFINPKLILKIIKWYTFIVIIGISLLLLIDAGLYQAWGVRLDTSLLPYLNTPELMISSTSTFQLVSGIFSWVVISFVFIQFFNKIYKKNSDKITVGHWVQIPFFLLMISQCVSAFFP